MIEHSQRLADALKHSHVTKTTVTVKVKDDAPDAKDDAATVNESGTVTGNVKNNDIVGQDTPADRNQST